MLIGNLVFKERRENLGRTVFKKIRTGQGNVG